MYFSTKSYLKSNRYHTVKQALNFQIFLAWKFELKLEILATLVIRIWSSIVDCWDLNFNPREQMARLNAPTRPDLLIFFMPSKFDIDFFFI
jgi:hypothetical protein